MVWPRISGVKSARCCVSEDSGWCDQLFQVGLQHVKDLGVKYCKKDRKTKTTSNMMQQELLHKQGFLFQD